MASRYSCWMYMQCICKFFCCLFLPFFLGPCICGRLPFALFALVGRESVSKATSRSPVACVAELPSVPGLSAHWQPWPLGKSPDSARAAVPQSQCSEAASAEPQPAQRTDGAAAGKRLGWLAPESAAPTERYKLACRLLQHRLCFAGSVLDHEGPRLYKMDAKGRHVQQVC